ncbi:OmpH family outer membrane protein [Halomonas aquamarina]|uniref:OmpH family outer membrane protein n=1 Tax=Vreelandella aquamarina TaxID=77097 RepID=A0ACC5VU46_9GAMM|nr:OmpH family outer membrane protein [Halomonas aquamarina]MBZ5487059.1 OmpH family outer membrane protein [Halomonas aquamarina]
MRKLTAAVCLFGAMVLPAHAVQAAEVAVLDWRAALMNTQSAQSSLSQLEGQIGSQQREAQGLGNELQQLQERLQRDGQSMAQSERDSLVAELQEKGSRFEQLRREVIQAQQRSEQQFLESAESKLEQAVEQVLARHNIDVLVEPQGVLHSSMDLPNVTEEVTQLFDSM